MDAMLIYCWSVIHEHSMIWSERQKSVRQRANSNDDVHMKKVKWVSADALASINLIINRKGRSESWT